MMPQPSPPPTPPFDAVPPVPPQPSHTSPPPLPTTLTASNTAAGTKRKRVTEKKFYAVREGKSPGIYNTWDECLGQVRGHKGALFKAFPSLHEAQAFIDGKTLSQPNGKQPGEQKYYAVQNGKKPGVYTDWPSAQAQIKDFRNPRHKKFNTKAEAEAFVQAGKGNLGLDPSQTLSPEEEIRRLIVRNSAPGLVTNGTHEVKDKEGNTYELGTGPLPPGAEDGFDPNIRLGPDGTIIQKTEEEKRKTKMMIRERDPPSMLRIYTDGSSLRNGQAGARAGVGVYFGPQDPKYASPSTASSLSSYPPTPSSLPTAASSSTIPPTPPPPAEQPVYTIDWTARGAPPPSKRTRKLTNWRYRNVSEALKGSKQTNQRAELTAIQRALDIAPRHRDVTIYTDSKYAIDCVTNWYRAWQRNGWVNAKGKSVENRDLVKEIRAALGEREEGGRGTYFVWVKGHAGDEGNVAADRLAVDGARAPRSVGSGEEADGSEVREWESSADGDEEGDEVEQSWKLMDQAMDGDVNDDAVKSENSMA